MLIQCSEILARNGSLLVSPYVNVSGQNIKITFPDSFSFSFYMWKNILANVSPYIWNNDVNSRQTTRMGILTVGRSEVIAHCFRLSLLQSKYVVANGTLPRAAALASVPSKTIEGGIGIGLQSIKIIPATNVQQQQNEFMNEMSFLCPGLYFQEITIWHSIYSSS